MVRHAPGVLTPPKLSIAIVRDMAGLRDYAPDDRVGISEAARLLGASEGSVRRWSNEGLLRSERTPGGQRRFRVADLHAFARGSGKIDAAPPGTTAPTDEDVDPEGDLVGARAGAA